MVIIEQERCIQCEACVNDCVRGALSLDGEEVKYDGSKCIHCGHCLAVCPRDCIMIDGDGYDCEDVEELTYAKVPTRNQFRNLVLSRRSVRNFMNEELTDEEIGYILESARYAPTGINRQGNAVVVVKGEKVNEMAADAYAAFARLVESGAFEDEKRAALIKKTCDQYAADGKDRCFYGAPVVMFVFADTDVDGTIAATTMGFTAQTQKIGFCYARIPVSAYADEEFAGKWGAPEGKKCVIALLMGRSEPEYFCSVPRKELPVTIF